ncbi:MAG TPA: hypothetical protein PLG55_10030 [Methanospirillum sp.]|uniref:hypothetical protein n=1 Tax=Methanospirillum sp. TaxID=45200 RepID=UPI001BD6811E|nr:hypothetical protein [Methanospirillum sp.]HPY61045.1 hypothetical protein [Methanospirillum sp.]
MKMIRILKISGAIACILLLTAGFAAAFSMSSGVSSTSSSGGFSSSSSTSSNLGYSSSTLVMTGGTPSKPAAPPAPAGGPGGIPANEVIPPQWQPGTRAGTFFDPLTQTSWLFDNVLQKFYTPTYGWFLVTQFTKEGKVYAQFYYDPKSGVFREMRTGEKVISPAGSGQSSGQTGPVQTPDTGSGPIVAGQQSPGSSTPRPTVTGTSAPTPPPTPASSAHPCRIPCVSCPSGYCDDCNQNGVCDDTESTGTPVVAGSKPQTQSDSGQADHPVSAASSAQGGLDEDPQSTIYYQQTFSLAKTRPIIKCDPDQDCEYCLDIDDDGACTLLDYAIILCNGKWGLDYMGDRDNICDTDILLFMDCSEPSECTLAQYCKDADGDGACDLELAVMEL